MESYLVYLNTTLGLDHIILPKHQVAVREQLTNTKILEPRFYFESDCVLSVHEQELFEKIMMALKLSPENYTMSVVVPAKNESLPALLNRDEGHSKNIDTATLFIKDPQRTSLEILKIKVIFTDDSTDRGVWQLCDGVNTIKTHSLRSMLLNPQTKKECWGHLQHLKNVLFLEPGLPS